MFSINDNVLYGTHGICKITELTEKDFGRGFETYYVLTPLYQNSSTIFVPAHNETLLSKMRKVLSKKEINELIKSMPDEETVWIEVDSERQKKYQEIVNSGDRKKIIQIIKTLHNRKVELEANKKRLYKSDEQILKEAEKVLYDEFASVLDIKTTDVVSYICKEIES